jgi:hypothetical protein
MWRRWRTTEGGVIVIGVRDENDVAVERTPVEMDAGEEGRMRSIGASNIVPYAPFYIRPVPSEETPGRGYYLILVPPSPDRPHAVRKGIDLRYPRRDGADKRWLSESEVADAYRDRFTRVRSDVARVEAVMTEGRIAMDPPADRTLFAVALAPSQRGNLLIDAVAVRHAEERARQTDLSGHQSLFSGPWAGLFPPRVSVGPRKLRIGTTDATNTLDTGYPYAEVHTDGCVFLGHYLTTPEPSALGMFPAQVPNETRLVLSTELTTVALPCLLGAARLSTELTGAFGDCAVLATIIGLSMRLVKYDPDGHAVAAPGSPSGGIAFSAHTVTLDSLLDISSDLLTAVRLVCSDLVHAFGEPELPTISPTGELWIQAFPRTYNHQALREWAEQNGIGIVAAPQPGHH